MNRSRLALAFLLGLLVLGLWQLRTPVHTKISPHGNDVVLFRTVVDRMRTGESYYSAMNAELRHRAYPTASILNWRPPATFFFLARVPGAVHAAMLLLSVTALALTVYVFRGSSALLTITATLMMLGGAVLPAMPSDGLYMPETWTGIFLVLSILAYTAGAVRFAVCCAILAACARELALPYVLASLALAVQGRRTDEVRWYLIGLCAFAAYYGAHAVAAISQMQPGDMAHRSSWIAFGGWKFVVRTVAMGGWYLILPLWTAAVGVVLVVAGLWGPADRHLKIMVVGYLGGFCIVGQSFNTYWGLLTGPAWALATVYGFIGIHRLVREA